jgi:hypothetical protein
VLPGESEGLWIGTDARTGAPAIATALPRTGQAIAPLGACQTLVNTHISYSVQVHVGPTVLQAAYDASNVEASEPNAGSSVSLPGILTLKRQIVKTILPSDVFSHGPSGSSTGPNAPHIQSSGGFGALDTASGSPKIETPLSETKIVVSGRRCFDIVSWIRSTSDDLPFLLGVS